MQLLLTANSIKNSARCLAGLLEDDMWARPVSSAQGGAIQTARTLIDGSPLRPLDVIEFDVYSAAPLRHQGENLIVDEASIRRLESRSVAEVVERLRAVAGDSSWFMDSPIRAVPASTYELMPRGEMARSLCLIEVAQLGISRNVWDRSKWRAEFEYRGNYWDLPLKDDHFLAELVDKPTTIGPAILCMSVAEPFREEHYKLVAGVIRLD